MDVIEARNVHAALPKMLRHLEHVGLRQDSRAGPVLVAPRPVTTVYRNPMERVLFWRGRDANPFFHLMEALWMLAGRNDVEWISFFNRRMAEFSDNGTTLHGAYGHRWLLHFHVDQLDTVVELLRNHPRSRRAVIQMWDCRTDLRHDEAAKDLPCNLVITVWLSKITPPIPTLDMSVFCRSNDIIWGAAGTNAVHFSILQEYLATCLGASIGTYYQISNNFHAYETVLASLKEAMEIEKEKDYDRLETALNPYEPHIGLVGITPIVGDADSFRTELERFLRDDPPVQVDEEWKNPFFPSVAIPMLRAYQDFRNVKASGEKYRKIFHSLTLALNKDQSKRGTQSDWLKASRDWIVMRWHQWEEKKKEG